MRGICSAIIHELKPSFLCLTELLHQWLRPGKNGTVNLLSLRYNYLNDTTKSQPLPRAGSLFVGPLIETAPVEEKEENEIGLNFYTATLG